MQACPKKNECVDGDGCLHAEEHEQSAFCSAYISSCEPCKPVEQHDCPFFDSHCDCYKEPARGERMLMVGVDPAFGDSATLAQIRSTNL